MKKTSFLSLFFESRSARLFFTLFFIQAYIACTTKILALTTLIESKSASLLPWAYLLSELGVLLCTILFGVFSKRLPLLFSTYSLLCTLFVFVLSSSWLLSTEEGRFAFYCLQQILSILFLFQLIQLTNDYFSSTQKKRFTPLFWVGTSLGASLSGGAFYILLQKVEIASCIFSLIPILTLGFFLLRTLVLTYNPTESKKEKVFFYSNLPKAVKGLAASSLLIYLSALTFFLSLTLLLLELQVQAISVPELFPNTLERTQFLSLLFLGSNAIGLVFFTGIFPRFIQSIGTGSSILLLPFVFVLSSASFFSLPLFLSTLVTHFIGDGLKNSFFVLLRDPFLRGVVPRKRVLTHSFLTHLLSPLGCASACFLFIGIQTMVSDPAFLLTLVALSTVAMSLFILLFCIRLRPLYQTGVLSLLRSGSFEENDEISGVKGLPLEREIDQILATGERENFRIAIDLIERSETVRYLPIVKKILLQTDEMPFYSRCAEILRRFDSEQGTKYLLSSLRNESGDEKIAVLLEKLEGLSFKLEIELVEFYQISNHPRLAAAALKCLYFNPLFPHRHRTKELLLKRIHSYPTDHYDLPPFLRVLGRVGGEEDISVLKPFLQQTNYRIQSAALDALGELMNPDSNRFHTYFYQALSSSRPEVKIAALTGLLRSRTTLNIRAFLPLLDGHIPKVSELARKLLSRATLSEKGLLLEIVLDKKTPAFEKHEILSLVFPVLSHSEREQVQKTGEDALVDLLRIALIREVILNETKKQESVSRWILKCLKEIEEQQIVWITSLITWFGLEDRNFFQEVTFGLFSRSQSDRANALEALHNCRDSKLSGRFIHYLETPASDYPALHQKWSKKGENENLESEIRPFHFVDSFGHSLLIAGLLYAKERDKNSLIPNLPTNPTIRSLLGREELG